MPPSATTDPLREGLLDGVTALIAHTHGAASERAEEVGPAAIETLAKLGARTLALELDGVPAEGGDADAALAARVERMLAQERGGTEGGVDVLVIDAAGLFAAAAQVPAAGASERAAAERARLVECLQASWELTQALATHAFIAPERAGRIVYVAPAPGAGEHAEAACAGMENLARTLSIEWARHRITTVAIAPGDDTAAGEAATLVAYLASRAGAYFSGCLLDLRGPRAAG